MSEEQHVLFEDRFLERHAGSIITDPAVAIVELIANAWDAWATQVDIVWPEPGSPRIFSIRDNGKGMTDEEFQRRWKTIDYNRLRDQGKESLPPPELSELPPRVAYGRNGKGRYAAFRFGDEYTLRTWRDGGAVTMKVSRGTSVPIVTETLSLENDVDGHGTEISAVNMRQVSLTADQVREIVGARFLADPNFVVGVNGLKVTFDDVPAGQIQNVRVEIPGVGVADIVIIDTQKADKTTRQHGIAWRVNNRIVGTPGWVGFDQGRLVDGRSSEAKRFTFIVHADFLVDDVLPDWSGFWPDREAWRATQTAVHAKILDHLDNHGSHRRHETKAAVRDNLANAVARLSPVSR